MGACPAPDFSQYPIPSPTAHNIMKYTVTGCALASAILSLIARASHVFKYRVPAEQRQIIRILLTPVVTAVFSAWSVWDYDIAFYLEPWGQLYEAIGLSALFLLFCQFAVPGTDYHGAEFWETLITDAYNPNQKMKKANKGNWPKNTWIAVFQFPFFQLLICILQDVTQKYNRYCESSFSPEFASIWVTVINSLSSGAAITGMLKFYRRTAPRLKVHRGLTKLFAFKAVIGLQFFQSALIHILIGAKVIKPSKTFSYGDLYFGIPNTLWAIEMVFLSLSYFYAFSVSEYSSKNRPDWPKLPWYRATLDSLDPRDILSGIARAFLFLFRLDKDRAAYATKMQLKGMEPLRLASHSGQSINSLQKESAAAYSSVDAQNHPGAGGIPYPSTSYSEYQQGYAMGGGEEGDVGEQTHLTASDAYVNVPNNGRGYRDHSGSDSARQAYHSPSQNPRDLV